MNSPIVVFVVMMSLLPWVDNDLLCTSRAITRPQHVKPFDVSQASHVKISFYMCKDFLLILKAQGCSPDVAHTSTQESSCGGV